MQLSPGGGNIHLTGGGEPRTLEYIGYIYIYAICEYLCAQSRVIANLTPPPAPPVAGVSMGFGAWSIRFVRMGPFGQKYAQYLSYCLHVCYIYIYKYIRVCVI